MDIIKRMKVRFSIFLMCAFALSVFSCRSVAGLLDKAGHIADGTAFDEKKAKTYRSSDKNLSFRIFFTKKGEKQSVFMLKTIPYLKFYGTAPDENGIFSIFRLHFIFTSLDGWLEGDVEVSGTGNFIETGPSTAVFSVKAPITLGKIANGGIKNRDKRIYGEPALTELRGRQERIETTVSWMRTLDEPSPSDILSPQKDFESYWQPILFPETVQVRLRPPLYTALGTDANDYVYDEGIKWNAAYTLELLPEQLRSLRDDGSLFRDWEEGAAWFYVEYYHIAIENLLGKEYHLSSRSRIRP
jgi:hypothetical protein